MISDKFKRMIRILRQILRKMGIPLYLHPRSKHTFSVHQHVIMLVLGQYLSTSYESFVEWLHASSDVSLYIGLKTIPHHTTIHKAAARIGMNLLHLLVGRFQWMVPAAVDTPEVTGIDGTGFEDHHSMPYYTYRAQLRRSYTKLSAASQLRYQLVQSCAVSHRPIHGTKHVKRLLRAIQNSPDVIVADAEYDLEQVHHTIRQYGSYGVIPVRGMPSGVPNAWQV